MILKKGLSSLVFVALLLGLLLPLSLAPSRAEAAAGALRAFPPSVASFLSGVTAPSTPQFLMDDGRVHGFLRYRLDGVWQALNFQTYAFNRLSLDGHTVSVTGNAPQGLDGMILRLDGTVHVQHFLNSWTLPFGATDLTFMELNVHGVEPLYFGPFSPSAPPPPPPATPAPPRVPGGIPLLPEIDAFFSSPDAISALLLLLALAIVGSVLAAFGGLFSKR